jgi:dCTP diphosphatase
VWWPLIEYSWAVTVQRMDPLDELTDELRSFAHQREWEQFHTPKNLAMALAGEAGELIAELQWMSDAEITSALDGEQLRHRLSDEVADVLLYLLRLCDVTGIDLLAAARTKIMRNEQRYPADLARGRATKYTELAAEDFA